LSAAKNAKNDEFYTQWAQPGIAAIWFDAIIAGCRTAKGDHVRGLAQTLTQWRAPILAWHTHGHSNGPVEGLNSLIKKVKRVAAGLGDLRQLPHPDPARLRRLQLGAPRHHTPLKREAPHNPPAPGGVAPIAAVGSCGGLLVKSVVPSTAACDDGSCCPRSCALGTPYGSWRPRGRLRLSVRMCALRPRGG